MRTATLPQRRKTGLAHQRNMNAQVRNLAYAQWRYSPLTRTLYKSLTCDFATLWRSLARCASRDRTQTCLESARAPRPARHFRADHRLLRRRHRRLPCHHPWREPQQRRTPSVHWRCPPPAIHPRIRRIREDYTDHHVSIALSCRRPARSVNSNGPASAPDRGHARLRRSRRGEGSQHHAGPCQMGRSSDHVEDVEECAINPRVGPGRVEDLVHVPVERAC
jgi:hypothetical protein